MKHLLFGTIFALCSIAAFPQTVTIKKETAEYFLEADDERHLLRDKIVVLERDVSNQQELIYGLRGVIDSHVREESLMREEFLLVSFELEVCRTDSLEEIERLDKQNRLLRTVLKIGAGVLIVLVII